MPINAMPDDLPLPISDNHGVFIPANAEDVSHDGPEGIRGYDPWTMANLPLMADESQPETGLYGEPSYAKAGSIVAEWGGMPVPVRDYQDHTDATLQLKRQVKLNQGPSGQFNGPQQTAWEASYVEPTSDYWSVILGG